MSLVGAAEAFGFKVGESPAYGGHRSKGRSALRVGFNS